MTCRLIYRTGLGIRGRTLTRHPIQRGYENRLKRGADIKAHNTDNVTRRWNANGRDAPCTRLVRPSILVASYPNYSEIDRSDEVFFPLLKSHSSGKASGAPR
jgi:hypothetical protein